jgi:hypothetical protein
MVPLFFRLFGHVIFQAARRRSFSYFTFLFSALGVANICWLSSQLSEQAVWLAVLESLF